jgi:mannose-1-phosphate guanylyltransferase/mannose-6-phosphate isomerase
MGLAASLARSGSIVTLGVKPDSAETGFGYIEAGAPIGEDGALRIASFREKPDLATAEAWLAGGRHFWNSGIFVFTASTFLNRLRELQPDLCAAAEAALAGAVSDLSFLRLDRDAFSRAPSISVDYAVMEHIDNGAVVALDAGWSDIGSWAALFRHAEKDADGNSILGEAVTHDVSNCLLHSERAIVAALGVSDLVVVDTPDALLVMDRGRSQDVPHLIAQLRSRARPELDRNLVTYRPWGHYETLNVGDRFQVKHLRVNPGGKLSRQMHHHRSEHWVVVRGTARVTRGETEIFVNENESVFISPTEWHRLENPGKVPLDLIEVQIGTYLGEDDIIRSDDVYGRG